MKPRRPGPPRFAPPSHVRRVSYADLPEPEPITIHGCRAGHAIAKRPPACPFPTRGRRATTRERCFPAGSAFGPGLPGSLCVRAIEQRLPPGVPKAAINGPKTLATVAKALSVAYGESNREWFLVLVLDSRNHLRGWYTTAVGGVSTVQVEMPPLFQPLIASGHARFALVHNHPSGDPTPSPEDVAITERVKSGGELLGLMLVDHLVIGRGGTYMSLRELGHL